MKKKLEKLYEHIMSGSGSFATYSSNSLTANSTNLSLPVIIGNVSNPDNLQPLMVYGPAVFNSSVYVQDLITDGPITNFVVTTAEMNQILNPETGMQVFNSTANMLYCYGSAGWVPAVAGVTRITPGVGLINHDTNDQTPITTTGTIDLANTGVTPNTYAFATVTVDAQGRITNASSNNTGNYAKTITCYLAATTELVGTYYNGLANDGVGATLTLTALGALTIDGVAAPTSSTVMVSFQSSALQNGIYVVTTAGSASTAAVLTRNVYYDSVSEILVSNYINITWGTKYGGSLWFRDGSILTAVGVSSINLSPCLMGKNNLSDVNAVSARNNLGLSVPLNTVTLGGGSGAFSGVTQGTSGQVLTCNGGALAPTWKTVSGSGTVTNVTAGTGLVTSPIGGITGTGSIGLAPQASIATSLMVGAIGTSSTTVGTFELSSNVQTYGCLVTSDTNFTLATNSMQCGYYDNRTLSLVFNYETDVIGFRGNPTVFVPLVSTLGKFSIFEASASLKNSTGDITNIYGFNVESDWGANISSSISTAYGGQFLKPNLTVTTERAGVYTDLLRADSINPSFTNPGPRTYTMSISDSVIMGGTVGASTINLPAITSAASDFVNKIIIITSITGTSTIADLNSSITYTLASNTTRVFMGLYDLGTGSNNIWLPIMNVPRN